MKMETLRLVHVFLWNWKQEWKPRSCGVLYILYMVSFVVYTMSTNKLSKWGFLSSLLCCYKTSSIYSSLVMAPNHLIILVIFNSTNGSLTPVTPRSFHLHQGFDCKRRCPRTRCVKKCFVWRNDICLNDSKCPKKHTHSNQTSFVWMEFTSMSIMDLCSCRFKCILYTCIPIKCDKHNAFKLSSSPHFCNQLHTLTLLSQFPQDKCPLLRLPTNWHGGLDMFIGLNDLVGP